MRDYFQGPLKLEGSIAGFSTLLPAHAILLGAPLLGRGSATDHAVEARCSDLRKPQITLSKQGVQTYVQPALDSKLFSHTMR